MLYVLTSSKLLALGITNASIVLHSLKRNFLSESFRLSFNYIARYALSRNTKNFSIKIHKSFAKQFIEIPLIIEKKILFLWVINFVKF